MQVFDDQYIIVTGGAGFIGSCLIRHLNDLGFNNIVVVDALGQDERWMNLVGKRYLDFIHKDQLFSWLRGREEQIQAIFHLGACSSTVERDADFLLENNYRYTIRLAEYALAHEIRFIYASSAATYGDGSAGFSDAHEGLAQLQPLNMYGYSKHMVDLWCQAQGVLDKVVGLKYFNVFGPNEFHKGRMASVLVKMVPDVQQNGEIRLFKSSEPDKFADGEQVRDFIYVKDAVAMTAAFLQNDQNGIYNIGRGEPGTWKTLAQGVFAALQKPENIQFIEMPKDLLGKYQNYTCADMNKAHAIGLPPPKYGLKEATIDYVSNYLAPGKYW